MRHQDLSCSINVLCSTVPICTDCFQKIGMKCSLKGSYIVLSLNRFFFLQSHFFLLGMDFVHKEEQVYNKVTVLSGNITFVWQCTNVGSNISAAQKYINETLGFFSPFAYASLICPSSYKVFSNP